MAKPWRLGYLAPRPHRYARQQRHALVDGQIAPGRRRRAHDVRLRKPIDSAAKVVCKRLVGKGGSSSLYERIHVVGMQNLRKQRVLLRGDEAPNLLKPTDPRVKQVRRRSPLVELRLQAAMPHL